MPRPSKADTPIVRLVVDAQSGHVTGTLTGPESGPESGLITLDSVEWLAWLKQHQPFAVRLDTGDEFSVRWLTNHGHGGIWGAYRTLGGVKRWAYLRRGEEPTSTWLQKANQDLWDKIRDGLTDQQVDTLIASALLPLAPLLLGELTAGEVTLGLASRPVANEQEAQARSVAIRIFAALQRASSVS